MAQVIFVEHKGERIDITHLERDMETRCDGCGEFVARGDVVYVNATFSTTTRSPVQVFREGHPEHVEHALAAALSAFIATTHQL